jgi:methylmalonyl-CoA/ethylmalonyl-CoA epimerase
MVSLHHVGFVVKSIADMGEDFARSTGTAWNGEIIHDPLQRARVSFFNPPAPGTPAIELVEPAGADSPVESFLIKRGGGLHHLCYETDSLESKLDWHRSLRDLVLRTPVPAVAFGGRRIAWV